MQRHELSQAQWHLIQPWLHRSGHGGQYKDYQAILNGISWRHEPIGPQRKWDDARENFAYPMSNFVALAIELLGRY